MLFFYLISDIVMNIKQDLEILELKKSKKLKLRKV